MCAVANPQPSMQNVYGLREDGTTKGRGWLGPINTIDGKTMTEKSIGVEIDGKETLIPLIVPTLSLLEIEKLKRNEEATPEMIRKATNYATQRMSAGESVWADTLEQ
jgi:hypothetical protein